RMRLGVQDQKKMASDAIPGTETTSRAGKRRNFERVINMPLSMPLLQWSKCGNWDIALSSIKTPAMRCLLAGSRLRPICKKAFDQLQKASRRWQRCNRTCTRPDDRSRQAAPSRIAISQGKGPRKAAIAHHPAVALPQSQTKREHKTTRSPKASAMLEPMRNLLV